jgi:predicted membrane-bound spermidine synthase
MSLRRILCRNCSWTLLEQSQRRQTISLMKHTLRSVATFCLAAYVYGEFAAHVYPFVLLPHLGIHLRVMALTLFAVLHAGGNFGWRLGLPC